MAVLAAASFSMSALVGAGSAGAQNHTREAAGGSVPSKHTRSDRTTVTSDGPESALPDGVAQGGHQHRGNEGHLPPVSKNVKVISKLELKGRFGDVRPGQIADVGTHGDYAYLNSWQDEEAGTCERGGVFVVDISKPKKPKEVGFIETAEGSYPGEGNQVIEVNTPSFKGDLLTINSEACAGSGTPASRRGGITLVDVTNPRRPVKLSENFGDITPPSVSEVKTNPEHLTHSAFSWQDGKRAYTVMVDNEEFEDIDIVDITDPRRPVIVKELDLTTLSDLGTAFGDGVFLHDMVVKKINGVQTMLVSYWDGGYAKLNVEDPANPTFIADTDFAACDPLQPEICPPEGNAHQAEFSRDNRYIVAADEDFAPFRLALRIQSGPNAGQLFNAGDPIDASADISELGDEELAPDTRFVGPACDADGPLPAPPADDGNAATERIALIERGVCPFEDKADNAEAAGYDGYLIFNNAGRPDGDPLVTNGVLGDTPLPGGFIQRSTAEKIFGGSIPAPGTDGADVSVTPTFDGWGYMHLYDARTMEDLDQFAIRESQDERYASRFGALSVHETANDPEGNLAYVSYYAGGFRVLKFGRSGLQEVGAFIDEGGNDFWGVQVVEDRPGPRLVLASDRDYGLYVFRYTGPGAVNSRGHGHRGHRGRD